MNAINKILRPIKNSILMLLGRALVAAIDDSNKTQLLQLKLLADEVATGVERFEEYGLSSYPLVDAQALAGFIGGNRHQGIVICVHDRRYRPDDLSSGDVVLYSYQDKAGAHRIHLKPSGVISIDCASLDENVSGAHTLDAASSTENVSGTKSITGTTLDLNGTTVTVDGTTITLTGTTIVLNGTCTIGGAGGTGKTVATSDLQNIFNNHVHTDPQGGNTGAPTTTLGAGNFTSSKAN